MQGIRKLKMATAGPEKKECLSLFWGNRQRIALVGAVIFLIGAGWSAWAFVKRPQMRRDVQRFSPAETWNLWLDLSRGPDAPQNPVERIFLQAVSAYHRWLAVGIAGAVIGLVTIGSAFCIPKPRAHGS